MKDSIVYPNISLEPTSDSFLLNNVTHQHPTAYCSAGHIHVDLFRHGRAILIDKRVTATIFSGFSKRIPPLAMATMDEVPNRPHVPLQWELARQTEIFLEDSLCMFAFPVS